MKDDGILVVDVIGTKTTFGTPWLDWIERVIILLLIKENFDVICSELTSIHVSWCG